MSLMHRREMLTGILRSLATAIGGKHAATGDEGRATPTVAADPASVMTTTYHEAPPRPRVPPTEIVTYWMVDTNLAEHEAAHATVVWKF